MFAHYDTIEKATFEGFDDSGEKYSFEGYLLTGENVYPAFEIIMHSSLSFNYLKVVSRECVNVVADCRDVIAFCNKNDIEIDAVQLNFIKGLIIGGIRDALLTENLWLDWVDNIHDYGKEMETMTKEKAEELLRYKIKG